MANHLGNILDTQMSMLDIEIWAQPFAGRAGAGLALLGQGRVTEIWLTEKHPALAAMWRTILQHGTGLASLIERTTPTMQLWNWARTTVASGGTEEQVADLELGFAALILNRCSRSGIASHTVRPIGGKTQSGPWTIGSRFNGPGLADALNASPCHWLLTYDIEPVVSDALYPGRRVLQQDISNIANQARIAREFAVLSDNMRVSETPALLPTGQTSWVRPSERLQAA